MHRVLFFHTVASCLRALGRASEALSPMRTSLQLSVAGEHWRNAAVDSGNLSELELLLGEVPQAVRDAEQSVVFADRCVTYTAIGHPPRTPHPFQQMRKPLTSPNPLPQ